MVKHNHRAIILFVLTMAIYYGWRMFALEPWYDELYTYYSFISRGPVYAAIHWPVPNNHVFYSELSGFLMLLGSPIIALRGISWLCSVGNLVLIYYLSARLLSKKWALACTVLYSSFYLVNFISIQGRGYTLAISFYLIALIMLYHICVEKRDKILYYGVFSLSLTAGLYTIPSNLYWVLPICLGGGLYPLLQKEWATLWRLIVSSVVAAVNTLLLYSLIWLAIGSNLLSKTEGSGYYGIVQTKIILMVPLKAWKRGMDYMLATPYVQSKDRGEVIRGFWAWLKGLMALFFSAGGTLLAILLTISLLSCLIFVWKFLREKNQRKKNQLFLYTMLGSMLWGLPIILVVQSVQPYYRVFTFLGVNISILLVAYFSQFDNKKWADIVSITVICFTIHQLLTPYYNGQYANRELEILELWEKAEKEEGIGMTDVDNICFLDDYQKYVLYFYWGLRPEEADVGEAEYLILPKELLAEDYTDCVWPILYSHKEINWEQLNRYRIAAETDAYLLYQK